MAGVAGAAGFATGQAGALDQGGFCECRQSVDEGGVGVGDGGAEIEGNTEAMGEFGVFDVEFHQGFEMVEPEFRLVAVIFSEKAAYVKYSQVDLGDAADSIFGYYNMESNRMVMYDLAGLAVNRPGRSVGVSHFNQFLASPNAPGTVPIGDHRD